MDQLDLCILEVLAENVQASLLRDKSNYYIHAQ